MVNATLAAVILTIAPLKPPVQQSLEIAAGGSSFIIYCTSNQDGTGECSRVDTGEKIVCEIVAGSIVNCSRQTASPVQCVFVSTVLNAQAYFSCAPRREPGAAGNRLNPDRFTQPSTPALPSVIAPNMPDSLTPLADPFN